MGKKRKLVESSTCSHHHQQKLQSSGSLSSLTSVGDCHICGKEPSVGPTTKKLFSTRKKSKHNDMIHVNFRIPNPVSLFSNRVAKKSPFFTSLKVKCHPIGNSVNPKRSKCTPQGKKNESVNYSGNIPTIAEPENEAKKTEVLMDEDLYCIPQEISTTATEDSQSAPQHFQQQQPQPQLRPLFFEVPLEESQVFVPRNWIFSAIRNVFSQNMHARGVILYGGPGTGKTAVALELVEYSCFGRKREYDPDIESGRISAMSMQSDNSSDDEKLGAEDTLTALKSLVGNVVAYHFCQMDNRPTCLVPEFIHSLAAQLCQAPSLSAYRNYLLDNPLLVNCLSIENCTVSPGKAFLQGIIDPLNRLRKQKKLGDGFFLIVIDSIGEAECHRTPIRDTISSFLSKQIMRIPHWLKFIVTIRTSQLEVMSLIPFKKISLDSMSEEIEEDLQSYVNYRITANPSIRKNIAASLTVSGGKTEVNILKSLKNHLTHLSGGCFLYLKLTLDLIQHGHLVIKSSGFKVLPVSLSETFSLHCNLRFPTSRAFSMVHPILATCLAALNPLTLLEIYHSINSLRANENLEWTCFLRIFKILKGLLIKRMDGTYMFFHSSFRDWLVRRDESESDAKFHCDIKLGNSAIAFRLTSLEAPLSPNKTIELAHHILKAGVFKNPSSSASQQHSVLLKKQREGSTLPNKELQAIWLLTATKDIGSAIASFSNVYTPNPKVTKLLLQAGASPNQKTQYFKAAPILGAYSAAGFESLVELLIDFGGDVNGSNEDGDTPLHLASEKGHVAIVNLLLDQGAVLSQFNNFGESALVKSARNNQVETLNFFFSLEENLFVPRSKLEMIKETMVEGCRWNHFDVVELCANFIEDFNFVDKRSGESPISMTSKSGHHHITSALILEGANPDLLNEKGVPPLILAAKEQHHRVIEALVEGGANLNVTDSQLKTALMYAAKQNDLISLEYLIKKGADVKKKDADGICVLGWACLRSNTDAVELLLEGDDGKVDVSGVDNLGRTPLDLAAFTGAEEIASMLLEKGALLEHVDVQGIRPLDRAVGCGHTSLVQLFLRRGAKLGPNTWAMASSKPQIIKCLLNKLLEDGVFLLNQERYQEASLRFQYSLRKISSQDCKTDGDLESDFDDIWKALTLNLIRCKAKMNQCEQALDLAKELIEKNPECAEVFYEKAQVLKSMGRLDSARKDALFAMALNEKNPENKAELRTQIEEFLDKISK